MEENMNQLYKTLGNRLKKSDVEAWCRETVSLLASYSYCYMSPEQKADMLSERIAIVTKLLSAVLFQTPQEKEVNPGIMVLNIASNVLMNDGTFVVHRDVELISDPDDRWCMLAKVLFWEHSTHGIDVEACISHPSKPNKKYVSNEEINKIVNDLRLMDQRDHRAFKKFRDNYYKTTSCGACAKESQRKCR